MMNLLTLPAYSIFADFEAPETLNVYFFKPVQRSPFSRLVQGLQWLLGAPLSSPTHVAVGYKGNLYELTTEGLSVEPDTGAAYRLASNVITVPVGAEESLRLAALLKGFEDLGVYFSVLGCVNFVWRLLWLRKQFGIFDDDLGFNELVPVDSGHAFFYCPPVSCTTFVWHTLADDLEFDWRIFAPAFLEQALERE